MYNFKKIEKKWQDKWEKSKIFEVKENSKKKKYYVLEMLPYPSGYGLHMGHARNYSMGDAFTRFKRMQGFNVLYPMGYDSFGLPAENAAIKEGIHPKKYTEKAINNFIKQQKLLGLSYDWSRMISTHKKEYYSWDQWIFLEFLKKGLVYKKKAVVNWCPKCNTVLANEQVEKGCCWRHSDTEVQMKELEQWFFKITKYCDDLLKGIEKLDWPENIKEIQRNWIGKSEGTLINFKLENGEKIQTFTTRPDTLYGVTFMVFAPEHPKVMELVKGTKYEKDVNDFVKKVMIEEKFERTSEKTEKKGMFIGKYAIHPLTKEKIPIYIANFVLVDYGTGIIMAVPSHDRRDFEFSKKYKISSKRVIEPLNKEEFTIILNDDDYSEIAQKIRNLTVYNEQVSPNEKSYNLNKKSKETLLKYLKEGGILSKGNNFIIRYPHTKEIIELTKAFLGEGRLVNSKQFNGLNNREAIKKITEHLQKNKLGGESSIYRLRDWLISRQRYWGCPIPIIYCDKCGVVPAKLPVELPTKVNFKKGGNPLETNSSFVNVKCPKCKGKAKRETDTMDTFVDSSWYLFRYCDSKNKKKIFDKKKLKYWMPVDQYIGGREHATGHLIYFRFFTKVFKDLGLIDFDEPALRLFNQGDVNKEGVRMSKSKGNVVDPIKIVNKFGADTLRTFLLFVSSSDSVLEWNDKEINGISRFLKRFYELRCNGDGSKDKLIISKLNSLIKNCTKNMEKFEFNKAIINIMEFVNYIVKNKEFVSKKTFNSCYKDLTLLLSPFAPHLCEEIYGKDFVSLVKWPKFDSKKIEIELEKLEENVDKVSKDIKNILSLVKKDVKKIYIYTLPKEFDIYSKANYGLDQEVVVYSVSDKEKYDPEGKSKKAKPGKPAIYVE